MTTVSSAGCGARENLEPGVHIRGRLATIGAPMICAVLLAAARPATRKDAVDQAGLRYDIQYTTTTMSGTNGQPATSGIGLAHVAMANGHVRIDVVSGEFAAVMGAGDFMIYRDTAHSVTIYKPTTTQYFQLDLQKLSAGLTNTVNGFGVALGVTATNVRLDFASLGAGDNVGPLATVKYRITQDYTLTVSIMGAGGKSTEMHSTTDYWFTPSLTMMVNPFAQTVQETAWLGADYGKRLAALQAKLPKGVPVKQVMTDVTTDSGGVTNTTAVTYVLSGFVRATIPDAAFQKPAGYTQIQGDQGPTALLQSLSGLMNRGSPAGVMNRNPAAAVAGNMPTSQQGNSVPPQPSTMGMPSSSTGGRTSTWNGSATSGGANPTSSGSSGDAAMDSAAAKLTKLLPQ